MKKETSITKATETNNKTKGGKYALIGERTNRHYAEMGFSIIRVSDTQCSVETIEGKTIIPCVGISRLYSGKMFAGILKGIGYLPEEFEFTKTEPKTQRERIAEKVSEKVNETILLTATRLKNTGIPLDTAKAIIPAGHHGILVLVYERKEKRENEGNNS